MIRAFRVGRRLARPTRLGTLSREWPACGGFGQVPAARPRSCTHDVPRRKPRTATTREQLPAALGTDGSKGSVAKVWSFEERPPVLRLCGAAAESSARKKKSTAPNVIRLLLIHVDICFLLVHVELGQYHVQGRYSG